MSVATSLMEDQSARITPAPAETLYQFNESPLLARQSQQESNARSYPRRIPLALKRAKGMYVEDVEGRTLHRLPGRRRDAGPGAQPPGGDRSDPARAGG